MRVGSSGRRTPRRPRDDSVRPRRRKCSAMAASGGTNVDHHRTTRKTALQASCQDAPTAWAARPRAVPLIAWSPKSSFAGLKPLRMSRPYLSASVAGPSDESRSFNRATAILQERLGQGVMGCTDTLSHSSSSAWINYRNPSSWKRSKATLRPTDWLLKLGERRASVLGVDNPVRRHTRQTRQW